MASSKTAYHLTRHGKRPFCIRASGRRPVTRWVKDREEAHEVADHIAEELELDDTEVIVVPGRCRGHPRR